MHLVGYFIEQLKCRLWKDNLVIPKIKGIHFYEFSIGRSLIKTSIHSSESALQKSTAGFKDVIAVYFNRHTKYTNTQCGQKKLEIPYRYCRLGIFLQYALNC